MNNKENMDIYLFTCTDCGRTGEIYEFAYIGPKNRGDDQCHPFMDIVCICNECEEKKFKCPHCDSKNGTWFDRSATLDNNGKELKYESFAERCNSCGKNVNAPKKYYEKKGGEDEA